MSVRSLYIFHNANALVDQSLFLAGRNMGKKTLSPVLVFFIKTDEGNILFDAGCDPGLIQDAERTWGEAAKYLSVEMRPEWDIRQYLKDIGHTTMDVHFIILSHLHIDHAGALRYFPNAQLIVQKDEYRYAFNPSIHARHNYRPADFDYPELKWKIIDGDYFLVPGITIILAQGHSPGTQALVVELPRSGTIILASDAIPLRKNYEKMILPGLVWDADLAIKSIQRLKVIAQKTGGIIIPGHDQEFFLSLKKFPDFYD